MSFYRYDLPWHELKPILSLLSSLMAQARFSFQSWVLRGDWGAVQWFTYLGKDTDASSDVVGVLHVHCVWTNRKQGDAGTSCLL